MAKIKKINLFLFFILVPYGYKAVRAQSESSKFPVHLLNFTDFEKHLLDQLWQKEGDELRTSQVFFAAQESIANFQVNQSLKELKIKFSKRKINTVVALKTTVWQLQNQYLKHYREFASLQASLDSGIFNCLTGVTLMSMVLDTQNIPYQIMATDNHVFLIAKLNKSDILIEVTDKNNAVIDYPQGIQEALLRYKLNSNSLVINSIGNHHNKMGLLAMFYLNHSLAYNKIRNFEAAAEQAKKYLYFSHLANLKTLPVIDLLIAERQNNNIGFQDLLPFRNVALLP
jgi:hypothetical protein